MRHTISLILETNKNETGNDRKRLIYKKGQSYTQSKIQIVSIYQNTLFTRAIGIMGHSFFEMTSSTINPETTNPNFYIFFLVLSKTSIT